MENYKLSVQAEEDLYRIYRWGVLTHGEIKADDYFRQLIRRFEMIAMAIIGQQNFQITLTMLETST